jgi:hypothetical protein
MKSREAVGSGSSMIVGCDRLWKDESCGVLVLPIDLISVSALVNNE